MLTKSQKIDLLYKMKLIREFENTVSEYKDQKAIYGGTHCYNGEEAVAVGVCSVLENSDYIVSDHRPHGHAIAKGMNTKMIMAELMGKSTGSNGGKGGSMHIFDNSVGLILSTGIVGSGIPVGCGAAFASKYKNDDRIACVFFGDGSANEGILHESLNFASVWDLPVLFLLEDNTLAITTSTRETSACNDYVDLALSYSIMGKHVDGQSVEEVYKTAKYAVDFIRKNQRPYFIQAHTIRFSEHAEGDYYKRMIAKEYRDNNLLNSHKKEKCPILAYEKLLLENNLITKTGIEELELKIKMEVRDAVEFAISSIEPDPESAFC